MLGQYIDTESIKIQINDKKLSGSVIDHCLIQLPTNCLSVPHCVWTNYADLAKETLIKLMEIEVQTDSFAFIFIPIKVDFPPNTQWTLLASNQIDKSTVLYHFTKESPHQSEIDKITKSYNVWRKHLGLPAKFQILVGAEPIGNGTNNTIDTGVSLVYHAKQLSSGQIPGNYNAITERNDIIKTLLETLDVDEIPPTPLECASNISESPGTQQLNKEAVNETDQEDITIFFITTYYRFMGESKEYLIDLYNKNATAHYQLNPNTEIEEGKGIDEIFKILPDITKCKIDIDKQPAMVYEKNDKYSDTAIRLTVEGVITYNERIAKKRRFKQILILERIDISYAKFAVVDDSLILYSESIQATGAGF